MFQNGITESSTPVALNGIYVSETGMPAFFLYSNGKVKIHNPLFSSEHEKKWDRNPEVVIREMRTELFFNAKEWWGDYEIKNDSIRIQWFNRVPDDICKRWVFEELGTVIDGNTIDIYLSRSRKDTFFSGACRLKFYPTEIKPDSTKAWFKNRKWYKDKLHKTRKAQ